MPIEYLIVGNKECSTCVNAMVTIGTGNYKIISTEAANIIGLGDITVVPTIYRLISGEPTDVTVKKEASIISRLHISPNRRVPVCLDSVNDERCRLMAVSRKKSEAQQRKKDKEDAKERADIERYREEDVRRRLEIETATCICDQPQKKIFDSDKLSTQMARSNLHAATMGLAMPYPTYPQRCLKHPNKKFF